MPWLKPQARGVGISQSGGVTMEPKLQGKIQKVMKGILFCSDIRDRSVGFGEICEVLAELYVHGFHVRLAGLQSKNLKQVTTMGKPSYFPNINLEISHRQRGPF